MVKAGIEMLVYDLSLPGIILKDNMVTPCFLPSSISIGYWLTVNLISGPNFVDYSFPPLTINDIQINAKSPAL